MAPKSNLSLFTVTLLILTLFSFLSSAAANSSPFKFLEHLKGCRKGDSVKGINGLKKYLHKFGYLDYKNHIHYDDDDFDEILEEAVKTYQLNYHLESTGRLDDETISTMMMPRCGVPDIINGTTSMRSAKIKGQHRLTHTSVHYAFPRGNPKWPPAKYKLTYGFLQGSPPELIKAVPPAFETWAKNSQFKFSKAKNYQSADLKISLEKGRHGDEYPFEGPGGYIAHAFYPPDGRFHIDSTESWSLGATPNTYDLQTMAVHEIGHLLGLDHSSLKAALMYPVVPMGEARINLHADDIQGIKALYRA